MALGHSGATGAIPHRHGARLVATIGGMGVQFVDWRFSADFGSAVHARTAEAIRFTRAERALLEVLAAHGDRVYRRDALLNAVSGYGSDVSDRSIDFIINRLRRKLGIQPGTRAISRRATARVMPGSPNASCNNRRRPAHSL